jgi:hypothetical protein
MKIDNFEVDPKSLDTYIAWRSDCWRNAAITLYVALKTNNEEAIDEAFKRFEETKKMFPYFDTNKTDEFAMIEEILKKK